MFRKTINCAIGLTCEGWRRPSPTPGRGAGGRAGRRRPSQGGPAWPASPGSGGAAVEGAPGVGEGSDEPRNCRGHERQVQDLIPTTATRAASVYMTAASTEEVLGVMAHLFRHGGLKQKHKLAILSQEASGYVFHELLSQQVDLKARAKLAIEGRSHLLEPIGPTVRALHKAGKGAALQRLLDIWGRAGYYPEGALEQLRHQWLPLTAQKTKTEQETFS
ncbi:unnamed protein product [Prorocentrum cordatum]|uniref:CID domain-containing protein n=1 Tax=Prorocentrum cordatum TaxID=2364126 RepID=A0ABN9WMG3_9DINO|nr:unnamed protein product [Polarella glacialis]